MANVEVRYICIAIPSWTPDSEAEEFRQEIEDTFQPHHSPRLLNSVNGRIDILQLDSEYQGEG